MQYLTIENLMIFIVMTAIGYGIGHYLCKFFDWLFG